MWSQTRDNILFCLIKVLEKRVWMNIQEYQSVQICISILLGLKIGFKKDSFVSNFIFLQIIYSLEYGTFFSVLNGRIRFSAGFLFGQNRIFLLWTQHIFIPSMLVKAVTQFIQEDCGCLILLRENILSSFPLNVLD